MTPFRRRNACGFTITELLVATLIIVIVAFVVAQTYKLNREMWSRGRDKVLLQQATTWCAERIQRDIRAGQSVSLPDPSDITITMETLGGGATSRRFFIDAGKLSTAAGQPLTQETCSALTFELYPDETDVEEVRFVLTLKDRWENAATVRGSAHLRNLDD
jgi:type II secretory pathway pseudopilin PulG